MSHPFGQLIVVLAIDKSLPRIGRAMRAETAWRPQTAQSSR